MSSIAASLMKEVQAALHTLEGLSSHRETLGDPATNAVAEVVADVKRRLGRNALFICVVGEKKAGKSTFLNALLGERVLGTAVRECTGTVTLIRHGPHANYQADLSGGGKERFAEVFADRANKLKAAWDHGRQQLQAHQQMEADLPREQQQAAHAVVTGRTELARLQAELAATQARETEARQRLAEAAAKLAGFETEVRKQGQGVPYFYRCLGQLPRFVNLPFCRPEWSAHLERVRALKAERHQVEGINARAEDAGQQTSDATRRVETGQKDLASAIARVKELGQLRAALPGKIEFWQEQVTRREADRAAYARERKQKFLEAVRRLTDMAGRGGEVAQLTLEYPGRRLLPGLTLIDTPGVNTDHAVNRDRAWEVIRREADGCILISDMQQAVSASTKEFVREVRDVVPHLVLILTKVDRALSNAAAGDGLPWDEVEEARRTAEKRFAREVGRDPGEILSFAVAAERALAGDEEEHTRRFETDVKRLFAVLSHEKTLMLASRSAQAIRRCAADITEAQQRAEASYRERIAAFEAQRIPDPNQFSREQMNRVERAVVTQAGAAVRAAVTTFDEQMAGMKKRCVAEVLACENGDALKKHVEAVQGLLTTRLAELERAVQKCIRREAKAALHDIESPLLQELRQRYQIAQKLAGGAGGRVGRGRLDVEVGNVTGVGMDLQGSVSQFQFAQKGLFAGGAAVGAVVGSFIPVIGTLFGAIIGGSIGWLFGPSLDTVKSECAAKLADALGQAESQMRPPLLDSGDSLADSMRQALSSTLAAAVQKYSGWIAGLVRDEEQRISAERKKLEHLLQVRAALQLHDKQLAQLMRVASDESRGLCR